VAPPEQDLAELDAQIEKLEDEHGAIEDRIDGLNHRLEVLAQLAQTAPERLVRGYTWGKVDLEGMEGLLGYVHQSGQEVREEIRRLRVEQRELQRTLDQLRAQRKDRAQPRKADRFAVRVPVDVLEAGDLELDVTYVCRNATWKPLYDLRLEEGAEDGPRVILGQLAEVLQRTGEDWESVELSVSTARPALTARLPELSPWYIGLYRPAPAPQARKAARMPAPTAAFTTGAEAEEEMVAGAAFGEVAPPAAVAAEVAEAEVREEGPAVVFVAGGSVSIPADGSPHKVFLATHDLPAKLDWITAPKLEAHAYRRARVENSTPTVLLAGRGSLFHGDTFVGTTAMPETGPGDEFEVYLGVDDQIRVERELVEREVDKGGVIEKVRRFHFAYRIGLRNLRSERTPLTVLDQLPVSRHEDLKVKLLQCEPKVDPGDLGELRWELNLAGGEQSEITFAFQVEMPRQAQATGLA
jgi:uncharacterized protein (TIGR02231 family)